MKSELKELKTNEAEVTGEISIQKHQLLIPEFEYRTINKFLDTPETTFEGGIVVIDWNYIVKVVEKIESLRFDTYIQKLHGTNEGDINCVSILDTKNNCHSYEKGVNKLQTTYRAVINFIKWYFETQERGG